MDIDIASEWLQEKETAIRHRRYLHQRPELSFKEYKTAEYIESCLKSYGPQLSVTRPTATSVVAALVGKNPGERIIFRADIDALPLQEKTAVSYQSRNDGIMHACGHDGHTAILLTTAKILIKYQNQLKGTIVFVFQAAEEVGGARKLLETGLLDEVDKAFALHLWSSLERGKFGLAAGPIMAAGEYFDCTISGNGGHAGRPNEAVDPISTAMTIISAVQTQLMKKIDPLQPYVFNVTFFNAGTKHNVIPDAAHFGGTIRTLDLDVLNEVKQVVKKTITAMAALAQAAHQVRFETDQLKNKEDGSVPLVNHPETTRITENSIAHYLGADRIISFQPTLAGEDFAFYADRVPATFIFVGAGNKAKHADYPHHHPLFNIDEDALGDGVSLFLSVAAEISSVH